MSITKAQARRALRHADIPWDAQVDDPREDPVGCPSPPRHPGRPGGGIRRRVLEPAASGRLLRRPRPGGRRALGLGRGPPCDSTLYRLLAEQSPAGFQETVFAKTKDLIARKVVKNDRQKLGVMTFDGKGTWSRADGEEVEGARQSAYDAQGSSLQSFGALRATLTSSSVCPCIGQKFIGSKEGEAPAFRELLPKVCDELGGQFRIVTGDAGLCARENAELVSQLDRWYLFGLKGNQPHLYSLARDCRHYTIGKPLARTSEKYRGNTIVRELFARTVAGDPEADIKDAQQLSTSARPPTDLTASAKPLSSGTSSARFRRGVLTRDEELALVRMHWAIENGCNWTMDVMLGEDEAPALPGEQGIHRDRQLAQDHRLQRGECLAAAAPAQG